MAKKDKTTSKTRKSNEKKSESRMLYGLNYPDPDKIACRTSTVARAMASTLAPIIDANMVNQENLKDMVALLYYGKKHNKLNESEKKECCDFLNGKKKECVYCGRENVEIQLDHLFPLVSNSQPTGYYTEPENLVPCCSECNKSKGGKVWYKYMDKESYKDGKTKEKIFARLNNDGKLDKRKEFLESYCKEFNLPYKDGQEIGNQHNHTFPEGSQAEQWWHGLSNSINHYLEIAQFQIESFNAGASEYRSKGDLCEKCLDNLFRDYVNSILNRGDNDLLKRILKNLKIPCAPDTQNNNYDEALGAFKKGYVFERDFQQNDK